MLENFGIKYLEYPEKYIVGHKEEAIDGLSVSYMYFDPG